MWLHPSETDFEDALILIINMVLDLKLAETT